MAGNRRGPNKKPTGPDRAVGKTRTRGHRPIRDDEPQPAPVVVDKHDPPAFLTKDARKHWPQIAKLLQDAKVLTVMDTTALGVFCECFARYIEARDLVDARGMAYTTVTGQLKLRPEWDAMLNMQDRLTKLLMEFGMTPASRAGVHAAPDAKKKGNKFSAIKDK
jgi:P27 family predicted phage terminase small subunit